MSTANQTVNKWNYTKTGPGTYTTDLDSFASFESYFRGKWLDSRHYVWRGQADSNWKLESTLDRLLRNQGKSPSDQISQNHLDRFKLSTRGRRGPNPSRLASENDWWALGQHYGLCTPLLDWTRSPYVAAYFAFCNEYSADIDRRAIYGITRKWTARRSNEISSNWQSPDRPPIVEFIEPFSDDNPRLVSQGGLFTRAPDGVDLETWVRTEAVPDPGTILMIKITIPNSDRSLAMRSLNRMNINHLSLFPDIYGAAKFVNLDLQIDNY